MAAAPYFGPTQEKNVIRVWDLESGAVQILGPVPGVGEGDHEAVSDIAFLGEHRILAGVNGAKGGLVVFDLRDGKSTVLFSRPYLWDLAVGRTGRFAFATHQNFRSPATSSGSP